MNLQLQYSRLAYTPPIPSVVPTIDMQDVKRGVPAHQPSLRHKKKRSIFTANEILGVAGSASVAELHRQANLYFLQGDWTRVIDTLEQLVKKESSAGSYFMLGMCYLNIGDYPNATRTLAEATRLQPNHYMTQFNLGTAYWMNYVATGDIGELEKAIQPYKKTIALGQGRESIASRTLGLIYSILEDWPNAEKYYLKSIELSNDPLSYQNLAKLYMGIGDEHPEKKEHYYLKAARTYEKMLYAAPQNSDAYNFLGHIYQSIERTESAVKAYEKAIEIDGHNLLALANLTAAYLDTERYKDARDLHQRIINIKRPVVKEYLTRKLQRPEKDVIRFRSDAFLGYGVACMELYRVRLDAVGENSAAKPDPKLLQEAEKVLKKAIEIDPENASAYYDLAVLYYRLNRPEEAQSAIRQALAIEPNNETIKEHVRKLLEEQLEQRLLARGLIKEIREPVTDFKPYRNRTMMTIRDKPLSQLVIEGRR